MREGAFDDEAEKLESEEAEGPSVGRGGGRGAEDEGQSGDCGQSKGGGEGKAPRASELDVAVKVMGTRIGAVDRAYQPATSVSSWTAPQPVHGCS